MEPRARRGPETYLKSFACYKWNNIFPCYFKERDAFCRFVTTQITSRKTELHGFVPFGVYFAFTDIARSVIPLIAKKD